MNYKWLNSVQFWALPGQCCLCGQRSLAPRDICSGCLADLPRLRARCTRCALPLAQDGLCGICQRRAPAYDGVWALYEYGFPLNHMITGLKYDARLHLARLLAEQMAAALAADWGTVQPVDAIVPVPLHPRRLRERGFNQAQVLAEPLARRLGVPLQSAWCRRQRETEQQAGMSAKARRRNLKSAFEVTADVRGLSLAIVDDVMTTGTTVEVLAAALKKAGARRVQVIVCARAGRSD